jgi:hypothetical protein
MHGVCFCVPPLCTGVNDIIKELAMKISHETGYRCLIPDLYKGKIGVDAEEASHVSHAAMLVMILVMKPCISESSLVSKLEKAASQGLLMGIAANIPHLYVITPCLYIKMCLEHHDMTGAGALSSTMLCFYNFYCLEI